MMPFNIPIPTRPVRSVWLRVHRQVNPLMFPTIHVNEYPKSGGTWLCRMLSETLDYRFDDNVYRWFGPSITKNHYAGSIGPKTVVVIRDPRDVAVSYFHHVKQVFSEDPFNSKAVKYFQSNVFDDKASPRKNLQLFTKSLYERPRFPPQTWSEFYNRTLETASVVVRYEDMRSDTAKTLNQVLTALEMDAEDYGVQTVADNHNIDKILAKRGSDDKAHFIRKGSVGNWASELDNETVDMIEHHDSALMKQFGYLD